MGLSPNPKIRSFECLAETLLMLSYYHGPSRSIRLCLIFANCIPRLLHGGLPDRLHLPTAGSSITAQTVLQYWTSKEQPGLGSSAPSDNAYDPPADWNFRGWLSGKVCTTSEHPNFLGPPRQDSAAAEASGLLWALLHALSARECFDEVVFHFDAMNIGFTMDGSITGTQDSISRNLRCLMQTTEALLGPDKIRTHHIKGHTGHPLNELANTLAIAANSPYVEAQDFPLDFTKLLAVAVASR